MRSRRWAVRKVFRKSNSFSLHNRGSRIERKSVLSVSVCVYGGGRKGYLIQRHDLWEEQLHKIKMNHSKI